MIKEDLEFIDSIVEGYRQRLTAYISESKSEEEFLEDELKMLKIMNYFHQNNLVQNVENIRDTKCEIHYNVYLTRTEPKNYF